MGAQEKVFLLKCVLTPSWRVDLGASLSGRPPGSHAPTVMVAEPPDQGGIQILGTLAPRLPRLLIVVTNWNYMENILHHTFYKKLRVAPEESPVLPTEVPLSPKTYRERMTQIIFEIFNVHVMYLATQTILSLYASGRTTGLVMDSGDGVLHTVPIFESYALHHDILHWDLAGCDPTVYLMKISPERGYSFTNTVRGRLSRCQRETLLHCFRLRHRTQIDCRKFRQDADPHALRRKDHHCRRRTFPLLKCFPASFIGTQASGVHDTSFHNIMKCDVDIRVNLYANVVLSSGTTMFQEIGERMTKDLMM